MWLFASPNPTRRSVFGPFAPKSMTCKHFAQSRNDIPDFSVERHLDRVYVSCCTSHR